MKFLCVAPVSFGEYQLDIEGVLTDDKVVIDDNNIKLQIIVIWMKFFCSSKRICVRYSKIKRQ